MKKPLLTLAAVFAATLAFAQTELLTNGGFEKWTGGQPDDWKSTTTASSGTLTQTTDVHNGTYAVVLTNTTANQRMASKELKLKAGTYTFSAYVKSSSADAAASARLGYTPVTGGKVGSYSFATAVTDLNAKWRQLQYEFTLASATMVNLVVMTPKSTANVTYANLVIDDASLTTADGGLDDDEPGPGPDDPTEGAITIAQAQSADAGATCKVVGTVVALCKNGALFGDETGYIYYYKSGLSDLAVGDKVVVSGATSVYGGFKQFTSTATVTKLSTETVSYPTPVELDLDAWVAAPVIQYVKLTGVLNISGNYYNLNVEGKEAVGSIIAPLNSLTEKLSSGSTVTVYGFAVYTSGSSTTYVNLVATKIDIDNLVIGKDISNTPETAYSVAQARTLIAEGEGLDHKVYVKGTVKGTPAIDTGFGNATYWITDGKDTLEVYRGLYLKEEKFVNTEALKAGDEVIVYGQLVDYNGTYEFTQGNYLYSINGSTDKPQDKPVVTFTDVTIAEAVEWIGGVTNAIKYDYNKTLKLKDAEVVFSNGSAVFVREGGHAVEFYNLGVTCEAGDLLNGEIRCTLENYYGIPEFIANDSTDVTTVSVTKTGREPVPTEASLDQIGALQHLCDLVVVKGVTVTKEGNYFYLNDQAGKTIQLRTRTPGIEAPEDYEGKTYDVVGIPAYIYQGVGQLFALKFTETGASVSAVSADAQDGTIYDLSGRRVEQMQKGIYIINGKKVVK